MTHDFTSYNYCLSSACTPAPTRRRTDYREFTGAGRGPHMPAKSNHFTVLSLAKILRRKTRYTTLGSLQLCPEIIHRVSKNVPPLACYNFGTRERISIFLAEML